MKLAWAQPDQRSAIWYFGSGAGLRFGGTPPQPLTDGKTGSVLGGVGTLCDEAGQLLFYSDGQTVWNRFHRTVPGAASLIILGKRQGGSTQNGLLLPHPKNPDWVYVFSIEQPFVDNDRYTVYYSLIDAKANGGEGGLISKLTLLARNVASSVAVVRHCNNRDFWLIVHEALSTNKFMTYLLDETGIGTTPSISNVGSRLDDYAPDRAFLKVSPDGRQLALGFYGTDNPNNFAEVFRFDNKTGQVTQRLHALEWPAVSVSTPALSLQGARSPADIAFSPNGQYLYATRLFLSAQSDTWRSDVYQINLVTKTSTQLASEKYDFAKQGLYYMFAGLENAPDGRLYVSHQGRPFLSVILNPNAEGPACGFSSNAIDLAGKGAGLYLPFRYPPRRPEPLVTIALKPNPNGCNDVLTATVSGFDSDELLRYQWFRNNQPIANANETTYTVLVTGNYTLLAEDVNGCRRKLSEPLSVSVTNTLSPPGLALVDPVCVGDPFPTLEARGQQIRWYTTRTLSTTVAGGTLFTPAELTTMPGSYTYYATQTDARGCISPADSVVVRVVPRPSLNLTARQVALCLETPGNSVLLEAAAGPGVRFSWQFGGQRVGDQATIAPKAYGQYTVVATDVNRCVSEDKVVVVDGCYRLYIPTAFSPNDDKINDVLTAHGQGISQYSVVVYNRWGEFIFAVSDQPFTDGCTIWDGRANGRYVQPGLYTYQLRLRRLEPTDSVVQTGTVMVIR